VAAAIRVADTQGVGVLSVRGLASLLDAPVMSLYRHIRNRDDLVSLMADAVLGEVTLPDAPPPGWRPQLELGARLEWTIMRRHPWLARVLHVSRPSSLPHALTYVDWVMRALDGTALDEAEKLQVHVVVHSFIQGLAVNLEAEAQMVGDSGTTDADYMRAQDGTFREAANSRRYPYFAKMILGVSDTFEIDLDALFELGLGALLDAFTRLMKN
jgi:AcrR family transcriptional regulator